MCAAPRAAGGRVGFEGQPTNGGPRMQLRTRKGAVGAVAALALLPATALAATIEGGSNSETLRGTNAPDQISGNGGNDRIFGRGAADALRGGPGNDRIFGGRGDD